MGVVPNRIFNIEVKDAASMLRVKNNLIQQNTTLYGPDLDAVAEASVSEHILNYKSVTSALGSIIFNVEVDSEKDPLELS